MMTLKLLENKDLQDLSESDMLAIATELNALEPSAGLVEPTAMMAVEAAQSGSLFITGVIVALGLVTALAIYLQPQTQGFINRLQSQFNYW